MKRHKPHIDKPIHIPRRVTLRLMRTNETLTTRLLRAGVIDVYKLKDKTEALETVAAVQLALEDAYELGLRNGLAKRN